MKIGNIVNESIPLSRGRVECSIADCSQRAFKLRNGIPYCHECWLAEQRKPWDDEANRFVAWDGTEYEVVRSFQFTVKE